MVFFFLNAEKTFFSFIFKNRVHLGNKDCYAYNNKTLQLYYNAFYVYNKLPVHRKSADC